MTDHAITAELVDEARAWCKALVRTPTIACEPLSTRLGVPVWLKLESLQVTGSFKVRGALFALARLSEEQRERGVVSASAGNHGKGVAWAARQLGIDAVVHVPATVDAAKHQGIRALGATVIKSSHPGYDDTEADARLDALRRGAVFVSAFEDPAVMAGNGATVAAEVLEDRPEATTFVLPVGGGGLAAGFAWYAKRSLPGARIVACQHADCPALRLSLDQGRAVTRMPPITTVAAGIEGGLGERTFEVLRGRVDQVAHVGERVIKDAFRWLVEHEHLLVEPTAAVPVAACLAEEVRPEGPVVVVISGRNVALDTVRALLG